MALEVRLPGSGRFFEIRFESISGSGAHVAGQIVASAAGTSR
jgi:Pyruvate/2-oxoacid:ferredoxin oxidoreductase gamma subunit